MSETAASSNGFAVEHRKKDVRATKFVPDTRLVITPALRTSGFLATLSDRDARTLLAVLTFLTEDGRIQATAPQVAEALGNVGERNVKERLQSLTRLSWQGIPVLTEVTRTQALTFYAPGRHIVTHAQEEPMEDSESTRVPYRTASRDELVERSREKYAKPQGEVERIVGEQLGHTNLEQTADAPEAADVRQALLKVGLTRDEATELLSGHPMANIQRQLAWLPERSARSPARYLIAAVRGDYASPRSGEVSDSP